MSQERDCTREPATEAVGAGFFLFHAIAGVLHRDGRQYAHATRARLLLFAGLAIGALAVVYGSGVAPVAAQTPSLPANAVKISGLPGEAYIGQEIPVTLTLGDTVVLPGASTVKVTGLRLRGGVVNAQLTPPDDGDAATADG